MDNKEIFASNLIRYMEIHKKGRREVSEAIGVSYYTFTDWVNGKKYARMDKIEKLADYFGILKSDLIEDKSKMQKNNDTIVRIVQKLRKDEDFLSLVDDLSNLEKDKLDAIKQMLVVLK